MPRAKNPDGSLKYPGGKCPNCGYAPEKKHWKICLNCGFRRNANLYGNQEGAISVAKVHASKVDAFINLIADGMTIRQACETKGMPAWASVRSWLMDDPLFSDRVLRARRTNAHVVIDEIKDIEEKVKSGEYDSKKGDVLVRSMQWRLSKLLPHVFGDKLQIGAEITVEVERSNPTVIALEQFAREFTARSIMPAVSAPQPLLELDPVEVSDNLDKDLGPGQIRLLEPVLSVSGK